MLDNETKRRIDTARDILVGKVPDPKSQVEQITIALIYKFMDDMDLEAEELGGHPNFFTGEYEKYGWRKIFDPALGGHEMLGLYGDAITRMALNPNLPQLFRDIFKNAYLPYRDPETLKSFLKIIDDFNYDQSEKLGDAFEYLLSVLGSQGDAGQFRTPRHIIDFMTAILNPRKTESILDPACGTAGFLISAYKHILRNNSSGVVESLHATTVRHATSLPSLSDEKYQGDQLTPDDRTRITSNIRGYDISPDMVRLSLVNLYLHGFPEPHIYEYDSLTSEDRWNEFYDVILANPPFMSPKGGIRPHKRFSVQSNRSEVLFVDLMAEHLTPGGRAAIVVPEGIIFQSGTAYKSLRKMLIDDYLVGVISLPAGVFNPYSGVKTSILWLDKSLARKTDQILFAKITADGFDLGAQRRPVKQNDLPGAFRAIQQYIDFLQTGSMPSNGALIDGISPKNAESVGTLHATSNNAKLSQSDAVTEQMLHATTPESILQSVYPHITLVAKSAIAENGDYNLSGERYLISTITNIDWPIIELSEIVESTQLGLVKSKSDQGIPIEDFCHPYIKMDSIDWSGRLNLDKVAYVKATEVELKKYTLQDGDFIYNTRNAPNLVGKCSVFHGKSGKFLFNNNILRMQFTETLANSDFILRMLISENGKKQIQSLIAGTTSVAAIYQKEYQSIKIPLPPLSIQQKIVAEIEAYQKIIDGARQVVENYKPRITIDPDWKMVELGEVCEKITDGTHRTPQYTEKGIPFLRVTDITESNDSKKFISKEEHQELIKRCNPEKGDILYSKNGTIGVSKLVEWDYEFSIFVSLALLKPKKKIIFSNYLAHLMNSVFIYEQATSHSKSGTITNLHLIEIKQFKIPLPPLETQQQIVAQIEREQALVNANKELIALFEQKIKDRIARVWGEE